MIVDLLIRTKTKGDIVNLVHRWIHTACWKARSPKVTINVSSLSIRSCYLNCDLRDYRTITSWSANYVVPLRWVLVIRNIGQWNIILVNLAKVVMFIEGEGSDVIPNVWKKYSINFSRGLRKINLQFRSPDRRKFRISAKTEVKSRRPQNGSPLRLAKMDWCRPTSYSSCRL